MYKISLQTVHINQSLCILRHHNYTSLYIIYGYLPEKPHRFSKNMTTKQKEQSPQIQPIDRLLDLLRTGQWVYGKAADIPEISTMLTTCADVCLDINQMRPSLKAERLPHIQTEAGISSSLSISKILFQAINESVYSFPEQCVPLT